MKPEHIIRCRSGSLAGSILMMVGMQRLLFLITIAAVGGGSAGFAQSTDARIGSRPQFPGIEVTAIGPEGGNFLSLVADTQTPGVLYAGAHWTGVFKTSDGGASWTQTGLGGLTVVALAVDPNTPNSVYAGVAPEDDYGDFGDLELFRSLDGGRTWVPSTPSVPPLCAALITDPRIPGTLYLSACTRVFKSVDSANTWSEIDNGLPVAGAGAFVGALAVDPQDSRRVYAVTYQCDHTGKLPPSACDTRIFTTADGGDNWTDATSSPLTGSLGGALVIDPQNPSTLYLHITWTGGRNGVAKSIDGGKTWTTPTAYLSSGFPTQTLAIDPRDPNTLYASDLGVYKSVDGAQTWTTIYQPPTGFAALVVDPQTPGVIFGAGSSGIIRSTDGGSNWISLTSGLDAVQVLSSAIDPQHSGTLYAGSNGGVYKTLNGGGTWDFAFGGWTMTNSLAVDPTDSNRVYAGTDVGVFKSVDGGNSWTAMNAGLAPYHEATDVNLLIIDPQHPNTIYAASPGRGSLFKSTDGAASWGAINSGLPLNGGYPAQITLAMDSEDTDILYAGTYIGSSAVFKSNDGGLTWTALSLEFDTVPGTYGSIQISSLAVDPQASGTVYAAVSTFSVSTNSSSGAIWRTVDAGATWQRLFAPSTASITALAVDPLDSTRIYAATTNGIITSVDAGLSWGQIPGSPDFINSLVFDASQPSTLYAAGPDGLFAVEAGKHSIRN
jgi:photosystem II stability/assembly factor-like uncharacterized protein